MSVYIFYIRLGSTYLKKNRVGLGVFLNDVSVGRPYKLQKQNFFDKFYYQVMIYFLSLYKKYLSDNDEIYMSIYLKQ